MTRTSKPLTDESGEVRVLALADMKKMIPFSELSSSLQATLQKPGKIVGGIDSHNSARDTLPSK